MLLPTLTMLLLIISWLGWQAIHSSVLNYQSAAISSQTSQQFLLAEHALFCAEEWLKLTPAKKLPIAVTECTQRPCILLAQPAHYFPHQSMQWWQSTNNFAVTPVQMDIPPTHQLFYLIEHLSDADTYTSRYYRITVWSLLNSQTMPTILQTTWKKLTHPSPAEETRQSWRRW